MTPATNNRNAQAFWEAVYLKVIASDSSKWGDYNPESYWSDFCALQASTALADWLRAFGTPEERVQFEEWQQAQDAGNEAEAGA